MDSAEAANIKSWFMAYSNALRMEYGLAMGLAGFDPDMIVSIQQHVAGNMIDWLQNNS